MDIPDFADYSFEIRPLSGEDGGGFLITFPDLPGCMADGESPEEALREGRDAFRCWMLAHCEDGRPVPLPNRDGESGQFARRLPKSLYTRLAARAKQEGVSLNALVSTFIAEGLGRRDSHA